MENSSIVERELALIIEDTKSVNTYTEVTSILLLGEKGSGKTYAHKSLCEDWKANGDLVLSCNESLTKSDLLFEINVAEMINKLTSIQYLLVNLVKQIAFAFFKLITVEVLNSYLDKTDNSKSVISEGILIKAIKQSLLGKVVVLIDEIDKATPEIEAYFLDFLQNFRIYDVNQGWLIGKKENCIMVFTSNGYRIHSEAFLRRSKVVTVDYPSEKELNARIMSIYPTFDKKIAQQLVKYFTEIRKLDLVYKPTISEMLRIMKRWDYLKDLTSIEEYLIKGCYLSPYEEDKQLITTKKLKL